MSASHPSGPAPGATRTAVALAIALVLLVLAPFASALEIHHALAEADHDGHQHSDFDLCQWVQHHSTSSIDLGTSDLGALAPPQEYDPPVQSVVLSASLVSTSSPRAPPIL